VRVIEEFTNQIDPIDPTEPSDRAQGDLFGDQ